jgi:hypothetical protein
MDTISRKRRPLSRASDPDRKPVAYSINPQARIVCITPIRGFFQRLPVCLVPSCVEVPKAAFGKARMIGASRATAGGDWRRREYRRLAPVVVAATSNSGEGRAGDGSRCLRRVHRHGNGQHRAEPRERAAEVRGARPDHQGRAVSMRSRELATLSPTRRLP